MLLPQTLYDSSSDKIKSNICFFSGSMMSISPFCSICQFDSTLTSSCCVSIGCWFKKRSSVLQTQCFLSPWDLWGLNYCQGSKIGTRWKSGEKVPKSKNTVCVGGVWGEKQEETVGFNHPLILHLPSGFTQSLPKAPSLQTSCWQRKRRWGRRKKEGKKRKKGTGMLVTRMQSKREERKVVKDTKKKSASQTWSEAQRTKRFQEALMEVKQPYGYAGARMMWCVWHVLGTQRSGVDEAAAVQQEQPEADLPRAGCCCCCGPPSLHSVLKASTASACVWCEETGW